MARVSKTAIVVLLLCVAAVVHADVPAPPHATLLVSSIDLGTLSPVTDGFSSTPCIATVRVTSGTIWELAIERQETASGTVPDDWSVNVDGTWQPLRPRFRTPIASGGATPAEGAVITVQMRFRPSFAMAPGRRHDSFAFSINSARADATLEVDAAVRGFTQVDDDHGAFSVVADHPSDQNVYEFAPRVFAVRSNTRWVLEVVAGGVSTSDDAAYTIEVRDPDGAYRPLRDRVAVAAGEPTGDTAVQVHVRLRLKLAAKHVAGVYTNNIDVRARAATEVAQ